MKLQRIAQPTLTAVEMDRRDTLAFTRVDGETVIVRLLDTTAEVIRTDLSSLKEEQYLANTELSFTIRLEIDGQLHDLYREVSTQKSFYEPDVIEGLRIWPDAVDDLFEYLDETHGECRPRKHARLAVQDASLRVCPEPLHAWCPLAEEGLDVRECYNQDDTWLGAYFGASAHGGLDINHPRGTPIWAPLDFDNQFLFNTEAEHGNNRWRGLRQWPNGDRWTLQCHHIMRMHAPENTPVRAGTLLADGAGVATYDHDHSHFVFIVQHHDGPPIPLDPWILFWQMYQDRAINPDRFYRRREVGLHQGVYPEQSVAVPRPTTAK